MNPQTLPANIESKLSELEMKHKFHQSMLQAHHEEKHNRRERHRARHFSRKPIPITLV